MEKIKEYKGIIIVTFFLVVLFILFNRVQKSEVTIKLDEPIINQITAQGNYSLNCSSVKYTDISIGGVLIPESTISIYNGTESQVLYIENDKAKYFGAEYTVIQDDESYLILIRHYSPSGLTEVVSINKEKGIGFDTNTKTLGLTGGPTTATYLISCYQI